ncbi:YciI family protein [Novosphingobium sp.]|uniref:YciI family protein n=1 Tax=Novosphingobium sp. TaxID=1874826 RepID=UPI002636C5F6|nr:YciI family protein [Novosphingobium sp.]
MQYVLLYNEIPEERAKGSDPAEAEAYWGGWMAYMGAMSQAGVLQGGNGLDVPETATTLRIANGTRHVADGPFADTKEALGGYAVIEVPDLDAALEWASRAPCAAAGSVEIRPVMPPPPGA